MNIRKVLQRWNAFDITRQQMSRLSDQQLSDIGIKRCDIERLAKDYSRGF